MNDHLYAYYCTTPAGVESQTQKELKNLGATKLRTFKGRVSFQGDWELCYQTNLCLRTANRVLLDLGVFKAYDFTDLYQKTTQIPWENYLGPHDTISIAVKIHDSKINSPIHTSGKIRHSLNDRMKSKALCPPAVDPQNPAVSIVCNIHNNLCSIGIDTSGEPLFKRGYRNSSGAAPMKETLAAAVVGLCGLQGNESFFDPFCGSGTLVFEAAMMAANIPPGILRPTFAFASLKQHNANRFDQLKRKLAEQINLDSLHLHGSDISPDAIISATSNLKMLEHRLDLNLSNHLAFSTQDAQAFKSSQDRHIKALTNPLIVSNLPYGKRMQLENDRLYDAIQNWKTLWPHSRFAILTSDPQFTRRLKSKADIYPLYNGRIDCRLHIF